MRPVGLGSDASLIGISMFYLLAVRFWADGDLRNIERLIRRSPTPKTKELLGCELRK